MPAARKPSKAKPTTPKKSADKERGASEAWQILASLRRPFSDRDAKWPVRRRVRNREEEPPVPEAYAGTSMRHKSAELDFMVRQIVALLGENKEQYTVYAPQESEEINRLADETQKAIAALMELLEDFHPIERPRPLCHDYQTADGLAIEKLSFNWDFFSRVIDTKSEEEDWSSAFTKYVKDKRELPIRRSVIDPLTCYWEFDIDGLAAVAEYGDARRSALTDTYKGEMSIMNSLSRIPISENTTEEGGGTTGGIGVGGYQDNGDLVRVVEIWTRTEFFLLAEGDGDEREVLVRQKHPFGRPPYFFAPGILTGSHNPLHKFQPLVYPMYQTTLELSAVRTARFNAAYLSSFKPFYVQYEGGEAQQDEESGGLKVHFLMPGNNIPSIKGGKIVPIDWTNLDDLVSLEQSLMQDRDRFGFQAILAGNVGASGDSTAWSTRMLRDQGMIQFNGVLRNYAQMRKEEIYFVFDLCKNVLKGIDLPITREIDDIKNPGRGLIKTILLTQKMVNAGFSFQVRLSAGKASDRIAIVEEFRRAHEAGEVPLRWVLEEGWGFQNASDIMDEVLDEQLRKQMMPKAIEMIFQIGVAGALDALRKELPDTAPPSPAEVQAQTDQQAQADAQAQAQGGGPPPAEAGGGGGGGNNMPGGVVEPGMGQGLAAPQIPPEQAGAVPMMQ